MPFLDATGPLINVTSFNILTLGAAYLGTFVTVYIYHRKGKKNMEKENDEKLKKKANVTEFNKLENYVDKQDRGLHYRINKIEKDTEGLGKKIDLNHNFMVERIENLNNNVMKAISKKE